MIKKISGFTILKNGVKFEYPFIESISSLLPLVDELIINLGKSDDDTEQVITNWAQKEKKIKVIHTDWSEFKLSNGLVLSYQTNKALQACENDWCVYLQADEVLHENDLENIKRALSRADQQKAAEGLLFDYVHFYGSYDIIQKSRSSYRHEVRAVRKSCNPISIGDAQSFRKNDLSKLKVISSNARIFHYGWVRSPDAMKQKTVFMDSLYHDSTTLTNHSDTEPFTKQNYRYKKIWGLEPFTDQHPEIMKQLISQKNWHWDLDNSPVVYGLKDLTKIPLDLFERLTGIRLFEYRCYQKIS